MAASSSEEPQQVVCPNMESSSDLQPNTHQLAVPVNLVAPGALGFSKVSLVLPENMPFDQWDDLMGRLQTYSGSTMWWVGDAVRHGEQKYGDKYRAWTDQTGFALDTIQNAKWVASRFPEFFRRLKNLTWTHHQAVAALEPADADRLLEQAEKEEWSSRRLRGEVIKFQRDRRQRQIAYTSGAGLGPWARLYADPPWQYNDARREIGGAEGQYETLPLEQICTFLTDHEIEIYEDAVLYLWVTVPMLEEGIAVMKAWGFEYRSHAIWNKIVGNPGSYFLIQTELLFLCVRGSFPPPSNTSHPNLISVRSDHHSAKPAAARQLIESQYPAFGTNNSLELFARETAKGWTAVINGKFV
jgi:N6-adenosine-specific RNA methylase IME4